MPQKPTDEELIGIGQWGIWALRQPHALQLYQESGATCPHGKVCKDCLEEVRLHISRIRTAEGTIEG